MKRLYFICILLGCIVATQTAWAQDIIIKRNADEIEAIVKEIGIHTVTYKRFSNPNGPDYTIPKSDIFMIKYANGEKEVFTDTPSAEEQKTSVQTEMQHREKQRRDSIIARRAEEREREYRNMVGRHNIKVMANAPGLMMTGFESINGYQEAFGIGGQFNFNVLYNFTFSDYTGDIGAGVGITTFIGSFDGFNSSNSSNITYLTIPIEATWRTRKFHWGYSLINAFLIDHKPVGEESIPLENTTLCPYRFAISSDLGWSIRKFDIGFFFTWWVSNLWSERAFDGNSRYNPSYELGFHVAYRFKIG